MSEHRLSAPLPRADAAKLKLGDIVWLTGEIVTTAGFPTHQRLMDCIEKGEAPPIPLEGACFFHMGSQSGEDGVPDYVNPTTSTRFNRFMPALLDRFGFTALAGKGGLDATCAAALAKHGAVYFSMIGGAAPLLTEGIVERVETGWDDLITQFRLTRWRVKDFGPLTVAIDARGQSLYDDLSAGARDRLPGILEKLREARG